jgi:EamA domain-containing membrane protein RarD
MTAAVFLVWVLGGLISLALTITLIMGVYAIARAIRDLAAETHYLAEVTSLAPDNQTVLP